MKPRAKMVVARLPATGSSAFAASAADWIVVPPSAPRVAPVATMIANITAFDRVMPKSTSSRLVLVLIRACLR